MQGYREDEQKEYKDTDMLILKSIRIQEVDLKQCQNTGNLSKKSEMIKRLKYGKKCERILGSLGYRAVKH